MFVTVELTRQIMYLQCKSDELSCNQCCSGKVMIIAYSVCMCVCVCVCMCVFVDLGIQRTISVGRTVICGLPGSTIFFSYYLINGTNFGKKFLNVKWAF